MTESDRKSKVRQEIWSKMEDRGVARFPTPVEGRIPNFEGAEIAAKKLTELSVFREAKTIKVNPDSPQNSVRANVIREGKMLYMPTPRLRSGFLRIDPENVPQGKAKRATTIKHSGEYGEKVGLEEMKKIDLVVAGSVAVTEEGKRVGKGGGYSDLEYAILRELDLGKPSVVTTVHPLQIVEELPLESHDVPIDWVVTPEEIIETSNEFEKPEGIDWSLLSEEDIQNIPILQKLRG